MKLTPMAIIGAVMCALNWINFIWDAHVNLTVFLQYANVTPLLVIIAATIGQIFFYGLASIALTVLVLQKISKDLNRGDCE